MMSPWFTMRIVNLFNEMNMRKAVVWLLPWVAGCSLFAANRDAAYDQAPAPSAAPAPAEAAADPRKDADEAFARRDDRAALEKALAGYEALLTAAPASLELHVLLARGYYFLGDAHLRADRDAQEAAYNKAMAWGERCMALDAGFKAKVAAGTKPDEAARSLSKEYAGCIYWAAAALGKWASLKGFATRVANKDRIKNWIETVTALEPGYFYGAPDRFWGALYAIMPGFMGKDLVKSEALFTKSLAAAPHYFGTKVLMAERLATEKSDRAMYRRLLEEVIAADPEVDPQIAPENRAEQIKAKELLAQIDEKVPE